MAWRAWPGKGLPGEPVREMLIEAVEKRFGAVEGLPKGRTLEFLTDNGGAYIADDTRRVARELGLKPVNTPVCSPQSNGMAESFVNTFMRISHEAIYQSLYIARRGALSRELVGCLRRGCALRVPRARARAKAWAHVSEEVMINCRPAEAEDRTVPGHWEGELLIGLNRSANGTLVERSTRFTMLVHLPRQDGYGKTARKKNGPALAGYGAITKTNALKEVVKHVPEAVRRSLTWDRGKELSDHRRLTSESGLKVFFAAPRSPWQRGTNENTNGLLRQYFPKGTDLSRWNSEQIRAVANTLNNRPRKILGWRTPAEAMREHLASCN